MKPYIKTIPWKLNAREAAAAFIGSNNLFILESSRLTPETGRYSVIGFDPFDMCVLKGAGALDKVRKKWLKYSGAVEDCGLPLSSGIVGYISYDYGLYHEPVKLASTDDLGLPDCCFGFYDTVIVIDHKENSLHIVSSGLPEKNNSGRKKKAQRRTEEIHSLLTGLDQRGDRALIRVEAQSGLSGGVSNFSKKEYLKVIHKALDYISQGEIYQVNLSQRFSWSIPDKNIAPFDIYALLSTYSPTPFGCYFDGGDHAVISNSPERFLKIKGRDIETRPMKGTRPRGETAAADRKFRREISTSKKDIAELLMITDLERNDLGRVCEFGSVKVKSLRDIEEYKTVYQATSTIQGVLAGKYDAFDALKACFPGGSITGCPKIRAMEIIEELEPCRRGIYTGSLGYIDFNGNADFNILIRTLLYKDLKVYFQTGGGVVADSEPEREYEETLTKAKAMRLCLNTLAANAGVLKGSNSR